MSSPVWSTVPRRSMSTMYGRRARTVLLLRKGHEAEAMQRDGLRAWLELRGHLWRPPPMRGAYLLSALPPRRLRRLRQPSGNKVLLRPGREGNAMLRAGRSGAVVRTGRLVRGVIPVRETLRETVRLRRPQLPRAMPPPGRKGSSLSLIPRRRLPLSLRQDAPRQDPGPAPYGLLGSHPPLRPTL